MTIACFGELMLRLTPSQPGQILQQTPDLQMAFAGAESNVATSLSQLGNNVLFLSKFPANPIGQAAIASLNRYGIDCSRILQGGDRLGTYFVELGHSLRPSRVVYDRAHSALSEASATEFDWPTLLAGIECLHLSGITPAISENAAQITVQAAQAAKKMGIRVSFDMNFRRSLWSDIDIAREIFTALLSCADIAFGNTGVMNDVFSKQYGELSPKAASEQCARDLATDYSLVAVTTSRNHHNANENTLGGCIADDSGTYRSKELPVSILDRLGTGDAFAAACLHGLLQGWPQQKNIDFATAAFALAHTVYGDPHLSSIDQIQAIADGQTGGYVLR